MRGESCAGDTPVEEGNDKKQGFDKRDRKRDHLRLVVFTRSTYATYGIYCAQHAFTPV